MTGAGAPRCTPIPEDGTATKRTGPAITDETVSNLGALCRAPERTMGPSLSGGVIALERPVHHRGSHLEHQMRASRRPAHLLVRVHPTGQQPLYRALGSRPCNRLIAAAVPGLIHD